MTYLKSKRVYKEQPRIEPHRITEGQKYYYYFQFRVYLILRAMEAPVVYTCDQTNEQTKKQVQRHAVQFPISSRSFRVGIIGSHLRQPYVQPILSAL
jgi:hypothetical protein